MSKKKHIHKKFNKIVKNAVNADQTKKFLVSKLSKNKYSYHGFTIIKIEESYDCVLQGKQIYGNIASFQLALSYCYNYLFKKSGPVLKQLDKLNDEALKQQIDIMHYKYYLKHSESTDKEYMYARINESNILYNKVRSDIRSLSTSI